MSTLQDFNGYDPTWCPGCGDWGIGVGLKSAFVKLGYAPSDVLVVFGVGCSGNMNDFLNAYALHSLHGRALPNAIGMCLAQHDKPILAVVGDGDCYGEGGNHLLTACRGNFNMTVVVHDNSVYGLTTGQVSPRASKGAKSKSTPTGTLDYPLNPLTLTITQGATFVAQAFAGKVSQMTDLLQQAIRHKGLSIVNILQPCVTFNKVNTYAYYQERVYDLPTDYDVANKKQAVLTAMEPTEKEKFPLGVMYKTDKPTYTDQLRQLENSTLIARERFTATAELLKDYV